MAGGSCEPVCDGVERHTTVEELKCRRITFAIMPPPRGRLEPTFICGIR
jgi:hypothetical protein